MRSLLLGVSSLALIGAFATPVSLALAAPAIPTAPSSTEVTSVKAEAAHLESEINLENQREQSAGESYDEDEVHYANETARLARVRHALTVESVRVRHARVRVRTTAIADYVYGSNAAAQIGEMLTGKIADAATFDAYSQVATRSLQSAVNAYLAEQAQMQQSAHDAAAARDGAHEAIDAAAQAKVSARTSASAAHQALSSVNGKLAEFIVEQAAHDAAVAAAHREAAAAERAATLAQTLATADPTLVATANQATASADKASSAGEPPIVPAGTNALGNAAVRAAESFLGVPYVWGGASRAGVDCSGLTMLSWKAAGVSLLHSAWYQYQETKRITLKQLEPGDLLFYYFPDDGTSPVTHVAMYVGSGPYGAQTVIQAPETGQNVSYVALYYFGLVGEGRPAAAGGGSPPTTTKPTTTTTTAPPVTTVPPTTTVLPSPTPPSGTS